MDGCDRLWICSVAKWCASRAARCGSTGLNRETCSMMPTAITFAGSVAKRHLHELKKAADGSARSAHEKKRERDLRGDENAPAMLCGSGDNANLPAGAHALWVATRQAQCGDKTEEDAADQRERDRKRENGNVDANDGFGWKGIRRKQQG